MTLEDRIAQLLSELVEARLALANSKACRAEAERQANSARADKIKLGKIVARWIDKYKAACADADRLAVVAEHAHRYLDGNPDGSGVFTLDAEIVVAIAAHQAALAP